MMFHLQVKPMLKVCSIRFFWSLLDTFKQFWIFSSLLVTCLLSVHRGHFGYYISFCNFPSLSLLFFFFNIYTNKYFCYKMMCKILWSLGLESTTLAAQSNLSFFITFSHFPSLSITLRHFL